MRATATPETDEEFAARLKRIGPVSMLSEILFKAGVQVCLCFRCKHQRAYGPCERCHCRNGARKGSLPTVLL